MEPYHLNYHLDIKKPSPLLLERNLSENWMKFKRDFENFLVISEEDDKDDLIKIEILNNHIGNSGLNLLQTFHLNEADKRKYSVILSKLEEYCCGRKNIVMERFKLLQTRQEEGESFDKFLETLVSKISSCEYSSMQEASILRDLIIVGINDTKMENQLLQKTNINLYETVKFIAEETQIQMADFGLLPEADVTKLMNVIKGFLKDDQLTINNLRNESALSNLENDGSLHNTSLMKQLLPLELDGNRLENWRKFRLHFENFLISSKNNTATDKKKIAFLETYIGESGLKLINSFNFNRVERGKYDLIINRLEEYCNRQINIVMERVKFLRTQQKEDESFDDFLKNLKVKISTCEYDDEENNILRDLLIFGLRDTDIQENLLQQANISLKETIKYVTAAEESLRSNIAKVLEEKETRLSIVNDRSSPFIAKIDAQVQNTPSFNSNNGQLFNQKQSAVAASNTSQIVENYNIPTRVLNTPSVSSGNGQPFIQQPSVAAAPVRNELAHIHDFSSQSRQQSCGQPFIQQPTAAAAPVRNELANIHDFSSQSRQQSCGQPFTQQPSAVTAPARSEHANIYDSQSQPRQQSFASLPHNDSPLYGTCRDSSLCGTFSNSSWTDYVDPPYRRPVEPPQRQVEPRRRQVEYEPSYVSDYVDPPRRRLVESPQRQVEYEPSYVSDYMDPPRRRTVEPRQRSVVSTSNSSYSSEPVTALRGIGKVYGSQLNNMGIHTVGDLCKKYSSKGSSKFKQWLKDEVGVRRDYAENCTADVASRC